MSEDKEELVREFNVCLTGGIVKLKYADHYFDEDFSELTKDLVTAIGKHFKDKGIEFETISLDIQGGEATTIEVDEEIKRQQKEAIDKL